MREITEATESANSKEQALANLRHQVIAGETTEACAAMQLEIIEVLRLAEGRTKGAA